MKTISKTAFYCCGVRMDDANSKKPILNDKYAKLFFDYETLAYYKPFSTEVVPNLTNVIKHFIIDNLIELEIKQNEPINIILLGAGFDTRAFRLNGGFWFELDELQIIDFKNKILPIAQSKNKLQRISIDFSNDSLDDVLSCIEKKYATIIIIEGVLHYLNKMEIEKTLCSLNRIFPKHKIFCDLMTKTFLEKHSSALHEKLTDSGAPFVYSDDFPEKSFLDCNYEIINKIEIVKETIKMGILSRIKKLPKFVLLFLMKTFMRSLIGFSIYVFKTK